MENNENNVQNQEKKQSKGLSAGLVIIMLIAVLIIGIGGGYLLSKNDNIFNKPETNSSNTNNESNTNSSNNAENKNNTQKTNVDSKKEENNKNTSTNILNEKQAYTKVTELYEIMEEIIYKDAWLNNNIEENKDGYLVVSCKYLDDYSTYMVKEVLDEYLNYKKIEKRGEKYYCPEDFMFSKLNTYISKEINVINIEENVIKAKVTAKYSIVDGSDINGDGKADSEYTKEYDFVIKKRDGKWVVYEFTCPF